MARVNETTTTPTAARPGVRSEFARFGRRWSTSITHLIALSVELDESGEWALDGSPTCAHWIAATLDIEIGTAREWLRIGRALATLPNTGQAFANGDLFDYLASHPLTLLAWSPLLGGAYTRTDRPLPEQYVGPDSDARLAVIRQVAAELGVNANQVVLAWMRHHTPKVIPLLAASTEQQMNELLTALDVRLDDEQMRRLNEAGA